MIKVKDIMTKTVIYVKKQTPIYEAVELLVENNISGIPVVEDDMTLVGVLSERDMLGLFNACREEENKTANDFMTQPPIFFEDSEDVQDVCDCLMNNYFRRVPITSKGKLVGIIARRDILNHVLQLRRRSCSSV